MKTLDKILDTLCIITTLVFFFATVIMVLGQAVCVFTLNGAMSASLLSLISERASIVAAITTIIALILAYMRGQMKE